MTERAIFVIGRNWIRDWRIGNQLSGAQLGEIYEAMFRLKLSIISPSESVFPLSLHG